MREFKFRAYGRNIYMKGANAMEYSDIEGMGYFGDCIFDGRVGWEIMQYTGIKDKNGKEIYEGDIVKYDYTNEQGTYSEKRVVEFIDGCFTPIPYEWNCEDDYYSYKLNNFEVLGNIYENPDLIK